MPVLPTYPGVYIEELSSGVRTITGVATSITAFIGRARKGSTDEPVQIFSFGDYERKFGGLWDKSTMSFAVRDFFLNGGGMAAIVRVHKDATASAIRIPTGDPDPNDELHLVAVDPGTWGDKLSVTIDYKTKDPADLNLFNISISEEGGANEKFFNVSIESTKSSYLPRVLEQGSSLMRVNKVSDIYVMPNVRPLETTTGVTPLSPPLSPPMSPPASGSGGSDGDHITDAEIFGSGMEADKTGLFMLEKTDLFNILCIPPYASSDPDDPFSLGEDDKPTDVTTAMIATADAYCQKRRAFYIIDPHSTWKSMQNASDGFSDSVYPKSTSNYNGLFFPRLKQANPLMKNQVEEFVPCGAVAGVFARTDGQRGVWKAPAGQEATLKGVDQLSVPLTDPENGVLNQLGINCLRTFPVYGRLVWGARTLEGADQLASEWKYIPVRRTALFIEESLYRGTKWVVFEPNDEPLWAQIRLNIGAFMHNLFRQGAFQGKTPREAYLVKCDKETTTENDINSGIVNILVGFAPLKPAEFVMIKIQQLAGQIES